VNNPGVGAFPFIADLSYADLRGAGLSGIDFYWGFVDSFSHIQQHLDVNLTGARIAGASFASSELRPGALLAADHDWTGTDLGSTTIGWPDCCYPSPPYPPGWKPPALPIFSPLAFSSVSPSMVSPPLKLDGASLGGAAIDGLAGLTIDHLTCVWCQFGAYDNLGNQVQPADLTGAHLPHANFSYSDLHGAKLANVDLSNADLSHADLRNVDCTGTSFAGADLTGADLTGASCANASFAGAKLAGAKLAGAVLTGATLQGATGLPDGWATAIYDTTTCPDATVAKPATAQTTCVGHHLP